MRTIAYCDCICIAEAKKTTRFHEISTTLFLFQKKKTCAKRKTKITFLVKVFTESKKVVGKAFLSKKRFLVKISVILWLVNQIPAIKYCITRKNMKA